MIAFDADAIEILVACGAVLVGSAVQGAVGFGMALIAAPILFLVEPRLVPGPMIFASLVLSGLTAHRDRDAIHLTGVGWGLAGRIPGTLLGAGLLALLPPDRLAGPLGALVLLGVVLSVWGVRVEIDARTLLGAGLLSGFMGTASSIGGPPIAMLYQHESGSRLRGTLGGYFVIGGLMSLIAIAAVGRFGAFELVWGLVLSPAAVIGFALSNRFTPWLDRGFTRPAVLSVATVSALLVIVQNLR